MRAPTFRVWTLIALTAAYFVAGKLGLSLAYVSASTTAVWPAAGLAVAALLMLGRGVWPAIALGAFLVNLTTSGDPASTVAIAAGNTLEALAAWWMVSRWAGGPAAFEHPGGVFRFAACACLAAPIVAATIGTAALAAAGLIAAPNASAVWVTWWLGDAVGIALLTPLVVMWGRRPQFGWTWRRALETAGVILAVTGLSWLVFGPSPAGSRQYPIPFLTVPVLLWPTFRLGARETAGATALLGAFAVAGTLAGFGPFVRSTPNESLLFVQAFAGIWMIALLAVSLEVEGRSRVEADVRALNETLEHRVAARTEEISRMHDRLALAQRVANVGSWEWDIQRNTIWWSDELFRIFKVPPVVDRKYEDYLTLLHPEDRLRVESMVGKAVADGRPFSFEHRVLWPDGSERIIQADGRVVTDAAGKPLRMVGTGRDVTDLRRADEERIARIREQAARVEAEDANRAKDEFLATLSHELRTPLNAALGWTFMLNEALETPAQRRRAADAVMRNLQAQMRLVSDMMDVSHITLRTLRLDRAPVDVGEVIRLAAESARGSAAARGVLVDASLPPDPCWVLGDAVRLQQVVWNLISNAVKFCEDGGTVRVSLQVDRASVRVVVEDDGPGIDETFLPHVFDRFRQADSSATRVHGGLGLGLAIARHLVEAHGGAIAAANRADRTGAIFTVTLPAASDLTGAAVE